VGFCLKHNEPVADEIKRIVLRQFELAATELTDIGNPSGDAAIHKARRRVKKIRALIRLVRPGLGGSFGPLNKRLRQTIRLLAPIADGQGVVHALDQMADRYREDFSPPVFATIRAGLVEREARADRKAKVERVLQRARATLKTERTRVKDWRLKGGGFRSIEDGLETSFRRARKAMAAAVEHPTADNYHTWRRRVKEHWFHVRLIEARCGNRLARYKRRLEVLDECLGEYHNFALLRTILSADPFVSRQETARRLRIIRRYQAEQRRRAYALGTRLYHERPRHFLRRVRAFWQLASVLGQVPSQRTCRRTPSA
jgi:CHAD domain-containing protein